MSLDKETKQLFWYITVDIMEIFIGGLFWTRNEFLFAFKEISVQTDEDNVAFWLVNACNIK